MTHKILARASGQDHVVTGQIVEAKVDMCFTHDPVCESLRELFYKEFGTDAKVYDRNKVTLFQDHLVPAKDAISRRLALAMDNFAAEQNLTYYYPYGANYGVCHIVMCEKGHVGPGELILGTDSHTVTYGAFNAFGSGVGMVDMLNVFKTGELWFFVPEVIRVSITGDLRPGVLAKDIILRLIGDIGMDGASYKTIEFVGDTIDRLSVEERMTLCNMVVEAGAKNGIMSLSPAAEAYVKERVKDRTLLAPVTTDPGFEYSQTITYEAADFEPMVACPHSPANVKPISTVKSQHVAIQQVYVGSCTGAKYDDIEVVAKLLQGKRIAPHVRLLVVPSSMEIFSRMSRTGIMTSLVESGAVIESPGCKACYGAHGGVLGDEEVCLSTTNRNFRGRMGNPKSFVYLASPYVAAKSALAGYITD
jgi:homoaconitate hydratase family protein